MFPVVPSYHCHKKDSDYFLGVGVWGGETEGWSREDRTRRGIPSGLSGVEVAWLSVHRCSLGYAL